MVSMSWICLVLLAKGLTQQNVDRFSNMYKTAVIRVVVNNEIGKEIRIRRCVRQGAPPSMLLFLYNMDPLIVYLEKRLEGITLYKRPVLGPVLQGQDPLPDRTEKYTIKGYADDVKPAIKSMEEFTMLDKVIGIFEMASGCAVYRDPSQDKCKVLLLGRWKNLRQTDIPVNYIKISDHLDMLGFTLMATYTKTRKVNGDTVQTKLKNTIGPWRAGRFMAITERSPSINTYALPKVWFKSHMMEFRAADLTFFNKQIQSWLFADLLEKPIDLIKYRSTDSGGLALHHIKAKSMSILAKSLIETSCHETYIHSEYHKALLEWNVYENYDIPRPTQSPYYSQELYNYIKSAGDKDLPIASMTAKDWYNFMLSSVIYEPDSEELIPCRVEIKNPSNDWSISWRLSRLSGLSSESSSFLWLLLHQLLPVRQRLERILPNVNSAQCQNCETGEIDSLPHAMAYCSSSSSVFNWMMDGLSKYADNLTVNKILVLDFTMKEPLPHQELPLVWFVGETLQRIWRCRKNGKNCNIEEVSAQLKNAIKSVEITKYGDMAPFLQEMVQNEP